MPNEWQLDRGRLADLLEQEEGRFVEDHPGSQRLFERGEKALLGGVPMPWMTEWASPFPIFAADAEGARFEDVDGNEYVDLCLGDTGAMTGHSPEPTVKAVADRASRGITLMLPTEDASWVAAELGRRFGLPRWQFALTATDANRFALRLARAITDRPKVLVYAWCYHGTVDESFAIELEGQTRSRPDNIGPPVDPAVTTRAVEWNDLGSPRARPRARRRRLRAGRAGDDQRRDRAPRPRLPRGAARAHPRAGNPPDHRRDPHLLRGPGRLHGRRGPRSRPADDRQGDRRRHPGGGLRDDGGGLRADRRLPREPRDLRCGRDRRDACGQRAVAGRGPGDPRGGPHRRGVRPHDRDGGALRGRCERGVRFAGRARGTPSASAAGSSTTSSRPLRATDPRRWRPPTGCSSATCTCTR